MTHTRHIDALPEDWSRGLAEKRIHEAARERTQEEQDENHRRSYRDAPEMPARADAGLWRWAKAVGCIALLVGLFAYGLLS
jgi:hypothetical protein